MKCLAERKNNLQNDLLCIILLVSFFCPDVSTYSVWKRDHCRAPGDQIPMTLGRDFFHIMVITAM